MTNLQNAAYQNAQKDLFFKKTFTNWKQSAIITIPSKFVWRQLRFVFFGALTSVVKFIFILGGIKNEKSYIIISISPVRFNVDPFFCILR